VGLLRFAVKAPFTILADIATLGDAGARRSFTQRAWDREQDKAGAMRMVNAHERDGTMSHAEAERWRQHIRNH